MEFINRTPFTPMTFETLDMDKDPFQIVILKGTFKIVPDRPLIPVPDQQPIVEADMFHGAPNESSVLMESDLAPFKPGTDIIVNANAHAPGRKPVPYWTVGVRVGKIHKKLIVTGPRHWEHRFIGGWEISDTAPCAKVPIRYEHAFGGIWKSGDKTGFCDENPVGVGFVNPKYADKSEPIPAPRIMAPDDPVMELGKPHKPEGLSAVTRSWQPRLRLAGTYDDKWRAERHPYLPLNFDYAYYNCAHPDLICKDYLKGDEQIALRHLHPDHADLGFSLPGYALAAAITDKDDYRYGAVGRLDTVYADVEEMRVFLVWRMTLPLYKDGIRVLETRMAQSRAANAA